jgi:hypothetical protein
MRPVGGKLATTAHGRGAGFLFGNDTVTFRGRLSRTPIATYRLLSCVVGANRFKCAVLRRSVPD